MLSALSAYAASLRALDRGESPASRAPRGRAPGSRATLRVFPASAPDRILLSGYTAEVWLRPGIDAETAVARAGLAQRRPADPGGIGLVLGAGNVSSIPVLDALYELMSANRVALVKLNPTMDALRPVLERALAPLIEPGFVRIVTGDGAVGAALTAHPAIDHVHVTGSAATFDAIVWGPAEGREERRASGEPQLTTPITAELGGVSPVIVVPGRWTAADLRFQAEHVVTMRLHNSGHNCIAGQAVIVSRDWPQYADFVSELRAAYARAPERPVWYPHAAERLADAAASPVRENVGHDRVFAVYENDDAADELETTEYFAPVLGVIALRGSGQGFLDAAVRHANERLVGTLGANVLVDPETRADLGDGFDRAIADLRYGTVAINAWTGFGFLTPGATWGAFPGSTPEDVGSGIGVVHNALLLDDVERTVVQGPFRPFPRSLSSFARPAERTVLPKPPWFVTARTGAQVSEGFTRHLIDGDPARLARTLVAALRS